MAEEIDPKTGFKTRKLTELRNTAAQEYQDAMMKRVDELAVEEDKVKGTAENFLIKGLSTLLDLKIKLDDMLGDNADKAHNIFEKLLLAF